VPGNKICWNIIVQLGLAEVEDDQFKTSDWVPQQNKKMLDSIRHFKTPYGTMGELFDESPVEGISKVYYEDMLFETWTHGRTVLIGDGMCNAFLLLVHQTSFFLNLTMVLTTALFPLKLQ
jgi:hypothetical protein